MRYQYQIGIFLSLLLILSGCNLFSPKSVQSPPIPLTSFLISENLYPSGWKKEATSSSQEYAGKDLDSIDVVFRYNSEPDSVSVYTVLWYESIESAKNGFDELTNHNKTIRESLSLQDNFPYKSKISQAHNILCESEPNPDNEPYLCIFQARYGSYITMISVNINSTSMSITDFTMLLQGIEKMFSMA